ncbi:MAG: hypothetical protein COT33_00090 [Candidatus Nealsonbacteria bacterium CG08_land_8_20_14_0_20_38_20]|uniref:Uncharacterized protein n=1 Tax=Candidatus Nealsonbacteria bacterium CG08_land_8_20_14_0_20_38_20 TaxID=1974705 RepID=A0A2H0YMR1_9BACT|nr:MAG: hypothetical protein COT33_00090 [Candidatus Nealsonbacteria bacterium CG08_land_8_20_14_0_20_38_20]
MIQFFLCYLQRFNGLFKSFLFNLFCFGSFFNSFGYFFHIFFYFLFFLFCFFLNFRFCFF